MALGRAEQSVKDVPQSWLNEGIILVKFSPKHRPGVLNSGQVSCFPHLTKTDSVFSSKTKEEIRAKEKGRKIQNKAGGEENQRGEWKRARGRWRQQVRDTLTAKRAFSPALQYPSQRLWAWDHELDIKHCAKASWHPEATQCLSSHCPF